MYLSYFRKVGPIVTVSLMLGLCGLFPARAQDSAFPGTLTGNVALTSDYVFRGYTQTQGDPALQAGLTWAAPSGFYVGAWGSNVDFNPGDKSDIEVDLSAGYAGAVDKFTYDIGAIYYAYPDAKSGLNYDYWEAALKVGYSFDVGTWTAAFYYTPDNFGGTKDGVYFTTGLKVPFADVWAVDANIGRAEVNPAFGADYFDWNVGLTYALPWFDANIRYTDTDNGACGKLCDERAVFTLSKSF